MTDRWAGQETSPQRKRQPAETVKVPGIWWTGHTIGSKGLLSRPNVDGDRCTSCRRIIVDERASQASEPVGNADINVLKWLRSLFTRTNSFLNTDTALRQ
ncbi:MAG TPA: hypothetical protein DCG12_12375 [Planctomycetaceae bacterium]|nr:hypothetical protein [Planctomycetaceae bacterium]